MYSTCSNIDLCSHCLLNISVTSHPFPQFQPHNPSFALDSMLISLRLFKPRTLNLGPTQNTWTSIVGRCSAQAEANVQTPLNPSPQVVSSAVYQLLTLLVVVCLWVVKVLVQFEPKTSFLLNFYFGQLMSHYILVVKNVVV